jgi:hypothetical protein
MPSSTTAARTRGCRRSSVSGTPMWLFRLPSVAKAASPSQARSDRSDELRHRGLAVAAGDGDQRQREARAPAAGQRLQRGQRVVDLQPGQPGFGQAALGDRRHRAGGACLRQKVVGVEALATQRHEEVARLQRAGVAVHPPQAQRGVAHQHGAGHQPLRFGQGHHAQPPATDRASSAARASARSENGRFTPATSCVSSWPLPASSTTSAGAAACTA